MNYYMNAVPHEESKKVWDGLEKSIIANFADDVIVGVKYNCVDVKITKTFKD